MIITKKVVNYGYLWNIYLNLFTLYIKKMEKSKSET
jgi:hypothetical protein